MTPTKNTDTTNLNPNEGTQPTPDPTPDPSPNPDPNPPAEEEIVLRFSNEDAQEEWLNKKFGSRYKRTREQIREEELEKARAQIEEEEKKKAGKFEDLYEDAQKTIQQQQERITELEAKVSDDETASQRIDALEEQLRGMLKDKLELVPLAYRDFVDKMTPEEQAQWFEQHAEDIAPPVEPTEPIGSPPTPNAPRRDVVKEQRTQDEEVREAQRQRVGTRL